MSFKLNMTDDVAEAKEYELPPSGTYVCRISELELKEVAKAGENFGKPYWKITLTVDEGKYAGSTIYSQVSLYESGTWGLLSLKQLCEGVHPEYIEGNSIQLPSLSNGMPDPDPWIGQVVTIKGVKHIAGTTRKNGEMREYDEFKVSYRKLKSGSNAKSGGGLPMPS